jgi:hypothetical protein
MTNQSSGESRWLIEPPAPGEVILQIAVGEGIKVTEETQQAIEALLKQILGGETEGYATGCYPKCADLQSCTGYWCSSLNNCKPLWSAPCLADVSCKIGKFIR